METINFCDATELESITGLSRSELWEAGFNLDDCDNVLFVESDRLPLVKKDDGWGDYWTLDGDIWELLYNGSISRVLFDIIESWQNYCVGCCYVSYNGKSFVTKHHA